MLACYNFGAFTEQVGKPGKKGRVEPADFEAV